MSWILFKIFQLLDIKSFAGRWYLRCRMVRRDPGFGQEFNYGGVFLLFWMPRKLTSHWILQKVCNAVLPANRTVCWRFWRCLGYRLVDYWILGENASICLTNKARKSLPSDSPKRKWSSSSVEIQTRSKTAENSTELTFNIYHLPRWLKFGNTDNVTTTAFFGRSVLKSKCYEGGFARNAIST